MKPKRLTITSEETAHSITLWPIRKIWWLHLALIAIILISWTLNFIP